MRDCLCNSNKATVEADLTGSNFLIPSSVEAVLARPGDCLPMIMTLKRTFYPNLTFDPTNAHP